MDHSLIGLRGLLVAAVVALAVAPAVHAQSGPDTGMSAGFAPLRGISRRWTSPGMTAH